MGPRAAGWDGGAAAGVRMGTPTQLQGGAALVFSAGSELERHSPGTRLRGRRHRERQRHVDDRVVFLEHPAEQHDALDVELRHRLEDRLEELDVAAGLRGGGRPARADDQGVEHPRVRQVEQHPFPAHLAVAGVFVSTVILGEVHRGEQHWEPDQDLRARPSVKLSNVSSSSNVNGFCSRTSPASNSLISLCNVIPA